MAKMNGVSNLGKYAVGFLLGSVGLSALKSGIAQKAYRYLFAGAFIAKDSVMETVEKVQATTLNIAEDAKVLTEKYYESKDKQYEADLAQAEEE
ncbi:MAG: DUF6110 family protein [Oscillospiraceae bacterium]|nr:DUF6110 family protein [Oscillospiraceae bacterium]